MKLKTLVIDEEIEVKKEDIIVFEDGLYGFEDTKEFVILDDPKNKNNPFRWLHAVNTQLCFVIMDPRHADDKYDFELEDDIVEKLGADNSTEFMLLCIVVIPNEIKDMTINLKSPIIVNKENNKAIQIILDDEKFEIQHRIVEGIMKGT